VSIISFNCLIQGDDSKLSRDNRPLYTYYPHNY